MIGAVIGAVSAGLAYRPVSLRTSHAEGVPTPASEPEKAGGKAGASASQKSEALQKSPEEQDQVRKLQQADTSVRQHEAAHQAAGGPHAGGASFTFQKGPDGRNYAVGGEVPIDLSREQEPQATIAKMEVVKRAALAPADPSPQDMRVAQQADAIKAAAQAEQRKEQAEAGGGGADGGNGAGGNGAGGEGASSSALAARGAAAYGAAAGLGGGRPPLLAVSA